MAKPGSSLLLAGLLLVAGCTGGTNPAAESTTSTGIASSTSVVATPDSPTTTTSPETTTTTTPFSRSASEAIFLVRNGRGVWQIDLDGRAEWLIDGTVAVVVDDTRGGLLYQLDSGRVGDEAEPGSSVVWWIPKGANAPQELVVPDDAAGQRVTLHDAFATDTGFAVLYTRHDAADRADDLVDRLRRIDVPGSSVTQLYAHGAFERGFSSVRTNGSHISAVDHDQVSTSCMLLTLDGARIGELPNAVEATTEQYVGGCRITSDGELAFFIDDADTTSTTIHVWDLEADAEAHRFELLNAGDWVRDIEAGPGLIVANRFLEGTYVAADVVALEPGYPTRQLQIGGQARVLRAPIDIGGPYRIATEVAVGPAYYRYGEDGAWRVAYGREVRIIDEPVWSLWDDHMGGVIYATMHHQSYWLRAGATVATRLADLDPSDEFLMQSEQFFIGLVDGKPTIFYGGYAETGVECDEWQLVGRDLESGEATGYLCLALGDISSGVSSIGGDRFAAVPWGYVGCTGTASVIRVVDPSGAPVEDVFNPGSDSCEPCARAALISPDGRLLAHTERRWTRLQPISCDPDEMEEWRAEQLRTTELSVEVVDLDDGTVIWMTEDQPDGALIDFDGRYLVIAEGPPWARGERSIIYDTAGEHAAMVVEGRVTLMRSSPLTLSADGLGDATFGDPVAPVMAQLTALLGPPHADTIWDPLPESMSMPGGFAADEYFRHSSWPQIGLSVVFSDAERYRDDGEPHLVAWYSNEPMLATEAGVRVGDTVETLVATYGDTVSLPEYENDECNVGPMFWIGDPLARAETMNGGLDGDPNDAATRITYLHAGAHSSC